MPWSINNTAPQTGRVTIVTGANAGLGYDTALALAKLGAKVVMACRNADKAKLAQAKIIQISGNNNVYVQALDLSSLASVNAFANDFLQNNSQLDLLINNAGIMVPPFSLTEDGFESQLAANHIGHFALTALLLELLEKTPGSRIVALSSMAHKQGKIHFDDIHFKQNYSAGKAYNQSKLACLMFAFELQRRLTQNGCQTIAVAAHPGVSLTNLDQHLGKVAMALFKLACQPAEKGALPTLYAALGEDIKGGDYCGPSGFLEFRGNPVKVKAKAQAYDLEVAKKLWTLSETMTGIKDFIPSRV